MSNGLIFNLMKKLMNGDNKMESKHPASTAKLEGGITFIKEVKYADKYPNSFMDLYLADGYNETSRPIYIFVHDGGYCWGDKDDGDEKYRPKGNHSILKAFVHAGFNVATINYALAPEYKYPTPVIQLGEAVQFLQKNEKQFGLDMSRVVFGGGSSGGNIIGQFINIQTNPDYAKEMNIDPVISKSAIKAAVFNCALLDNERFENVGGKKPLKLFGKCGRFYLGSDGLVGNEKAIQSNVISHATADFPASFITEGNYNSFMDQAIDFDRRLTELHVNHKLNMYPINEGELGHGYDEFGGPFSDDNLKKTLEFLAPICNG